MMRGGQADPLGQMMEVGLDQLALTVRRASAGQLRSYSSDQRIRIFGLRRRKVLELDFHVFQVRGKNLFQNSHVDGLGRGLSTALPFPLSRGIMTDNGPQAGHFMP